MQYCTVEKKSLIWPQNDFSLQRCFTLCEIVLHDLSFFFFFWIPGSSQQTAQMKQATPPSGAVHVVCFKPRIVHSTLNMHVDYSAVKGWVWITRDAMIMQRGIQPPSCYSSIFQGCTNENGTKIKSTSFERKKKRVTETLTFCISGDPSGCFHPEFKRIGQHNDFKSLLCQNEYYTEERRRSKGEKKK